ncbi:phage tail protein [Tropicibacter oceani]|uniref:Tail fiber protein n=1 Tax=Tropicibacter oceani TaxID=3058420 RepID=A0ABY8QEC5_9RHOB|nr:tail fiber protein [Tropicibacter oceani]WGW02975.1 tail fiber protein [Tropicibacter oceani]
MSEFYTGQIVLVGFNWAMRNFALCDGQLLEISSNSALFSLLGTAYGGNGVHNFALPDLRGRVPMHQGIGNGLSPRSVGQRAGQEHVTLNASEMPAHTHNARLMAEGRNGNADSPAGNMIANHSGGFRPNVPAEDVPMSPASVVSDTVGGNQPHDNMPPYLVMSYQICLYGAYPSRE